MGRTCWGEKHDGDKIGLEELWPYQYMYLGISKIVHFLTSHPDIDDTLTNGKDNVTLYPVSDETPSMKCEKKSH